MNTLLERRLIHATETFDEALYEVARPSNISAINADVKKAEIILIKAGPGNPVHKHYYPNSLLETAVSKGMFEAKQCYANHSTEQQQKIQPEGTIRDLLGFFKDARIQYESAGANVLGFKPGEKRAMVVADFYPEVGQEFVLEKLRTAQLFNQLFPDNEDGYVGWSIHAGGSSSPTNYSGSMWKNVTEFTVIGSIDMVTQAGAGGRLLTLKEVAMKGGLLANFGRRRPSVAEARSQLSAHVVDSLKEAGVKPTSSQLKIFNRGLELLPRDLFTENFVLTTLIESGIECDEDQGTKFEEALTKDGQFSDLIVKCNEAKNSGHAYDASGASPEDEEEEAGVMSDDTGKNVGRKKPVQEGGKGAASASNDEDGDDDSQEAERAMDDAKEARIFARRIKDPNARQFCESLIQRNEGLHGNIRSLRSNLRAERQMREAAESRLGVAREDLRENNAKKLLTQSKLTENQKAALFPELCEASLVEQPKLISKWEGLFEDVNGRRVVAGPGNVQRLGESNGRTVTFSAMRD